MKSMQPSKMYCDQNKSVRFFKFCTQIVIPRQTEENGKPVTLPQLLFITFLLKQATELRAGNVFKRTWFRESEKLFCIGLTIVSLPEHHRTLHEAKLD